MRDAARELADDFHFLRLAQLALQFSLRGDIAHGRLHHQLAGNNHRREQDAAGEFRAIDAAMQPLEGVGALAAGDGDHLLGLRGRGPAIGLDLR